MNQKFKKELKMIAFALLVFIRQTIARCYCFETITWPSAKQNYVGYIEHLITACEDFDMQQQCLLAVSLTQLPIGSFDCSTGLLTSMHEPSQLIYRRTDDYNKDGYCYSISIHDECLRVSKLLNRTGICSDIPKRLVYSYEQTSKESCGNIPNFDCPYSQKSSSSSSITLTTNTLQLAITLLLSMNW